MKTPFKEHIEALVRDKVPQEKGDSKSVVAEFQKKPISFSLQKLTSHISIPNCCLFGNSHWGKTHNLFQNTHFKNTYS